jgi:hypothetical protein
MMDARMTPNTVAEKGLVMPNEVSLRAQGSAPPSKAEPAIDCSRDPLDRLQVANDRLVGRGASLGTRR